MLYAFAKSAAYGIFKNKARQSSDKSKKVLTIQSKKNRRLTANVLVLPGTEKPPRRKLLAEQKPQKPLQPHVQYSVIYARSGAMPRCSQQKAARYRIRGISYSKTVLDRLALWLKKKNESKCTMQCI